MLRRQRTQTSVGLTIELNEDIIPDLDDVWQIGVDQLAGVSSTDSIVVNFLRLLYIHIYIYQDCHIEQILFWLKYVGDVFFKTVESNQTKSKE